LDNAAMPIAIAGLRALPAGQPRTVVSPLVELGSALHVLADPAHHRADGWAAGVRESLSPSLRARTSEWAWTCQAIRAAPFLSTTESPTDFDTELERLRDEPPRRLSTRLLRPISRTGDLAVARRWSRSRGPETADRVDTLIDRPADGVAEFLDFLAESWTAWFAEEWDRVEPLLHGRSRGLRRQLTGADDIARTMASLDPSIKATAGGGGVTIAKVQNVRHDVSKRGLAIAFSVFVRPHLYVGNVPGQPLLLICPAEPSPVRTAPMTDVVARADALAHPGRLEVARAIATEPRTAGEISALWGMDQTLVNRHLRSLASAGLARTTRRGRFVQYGLDLDAVRGLGDELALLLLR
jgi:DNA-binding transcriptional ArsR family regulator